MKLPDNDMVNPLKNREFIDNQDIEDTFDDYMRATGSIEALENMQRLIDAWRAELIKKAS